MSVEYYYMNDLNTLYNASVGDKTDGGEHHMKMMVAHDNLEAYMQKMEHWRDTALQLSRNNGEAQAKINALEADYVISNRELLVKQVEIQGLNTRIAELEGANDVLAGACETLRKKIGQLTEQVGITDCPDVEVMEYKARIAELEHDLTNKEIEYTDLWNDALAFQSRIAELEAERRWIPVSERLPEVQ